MAQSHNLNVNLSSPNPSSFMCYVLSCFSRVQLFVTLWTVAHQVPLSVGFSRQEYWSGFPFPSPGVLPDLGIESFPALQADSLPSEPPGKPPGAEIRLKDRMTPKPGRGFFNSCWSPWAPFSGPSPVPSQVYTGLHLNPHLLS